MSPKPPELGLLLFSSSAGVANLLSRQNLRAFTRQVRAEIRLGLETVRET